jgi:hypothetical protein
VADEFSQIDLAGYSVTIRKVLLGRLPQHSTVVRPADIDFLMERVAAYHCRS